MKKEKQTAAAQKLTSFSWKLHLNTHKFAKRQWGMKNVVFSMFIFHNTSAGKL